MSTPEPDMQQIEHEPAVRAILTLIRSTSAEQTERARAVIERQTQQLTRLVEDLLDITRISRGKVRIERERLEMVELLRECVEDQRESLSRADKV